MKGLETGKDKLQKICDTLRKETLEPAKQEASEIVENAHLQAADIVRSAEERAARLLKEVEEDLAQKKKVFEASLSMACRQGIESLKQKIEKELFNKELSDTITHEMAEPKVIAHLLTSLMKMVEEKGLDGELSISFPKGVSVRSVNALLTSQILERLKRHPIELSDFEGGVQIHFKDRRVTLDLSNRVLRELIATYIRRDFRDLVFAV